MNKKASNPNPPNRKFKPLPPPSPPKIIKGYKMNKTKRKQLKIYYIVAWNPKCWDSFIQHQIEIRECYKLKKGYLNVCDYSDNPTDCKYICNEGCHIDLWCFNWTDKEDIFTNLEKAKEYALKKIDEMYLSRCKHLIEERDEAIKKINGEDNENK